jgi:deoxyhypusine synthase
VAGVINQSNQRKMKKVESRKRRHVIEEMTKCASLNGNTLAQPIAGEVVQMLREYTKTLMRYIAEDQERIDDLSKLVKSYKDIEEIMRPFFKKQVSKVTERDRHDDRIGWEVGHWIDESVEVCAVYIPEADEPVEGDFSHTQSEFPKEL